MPALTPADYAAINRHALERFQDFTDGVLPRHQAGPVPRMLNPNTEGRLSFFRLLDANSGRWGDMNGHPVDPADQVDLIGCVRHMAGSPDVTREQAAIALRSHLNQLPPIQSWARPEIQITESQRRAGARAVRTSGRRV